MRQLIFVLFGSLMLVAHTVYAGYQCFGTGPNLKINGTREAIVETHSENTPHNTKFLFTKPVKEGSIVYKCTSSSYYENQHCPCAYVVKNNKISSCPAQTEASVAFNPAGFSLFISEQFQNVLYLSPQQKTTCDQYIGI